MWPFKSKFQKLKREDVVDAICALEKESNDIEEAIMAAQPQIDALMKKGQKETVRDLKLFYAKKINSLKAEREQNIKRAVYLMYNIQLLNRLKKTIDDNQFYKNTSKIALGSLLGDQKGLAKFLNDALQTKVREEDILTSADDMFNEVEASYEENSKIYGKNENDDQLLSMFETQEAVDGELAMFGADAEETGAADSAEQ